MAEPGSPNDLAPAASLTTQLSSDPNENSQSLSQYHFPGTQPIVPLRRERRSTVGSEGKPLALRHGSFVSARSARRSICSQRSSASGAAKAVKLQTFTLADILTSSAGDGQGHSRRGSADNNLPGMNALAVMLRQQQQEWEEAERRKTRTQRARERLRAFFSSRAVEAVIFLVILANVLVPLIYGGVKHSSHGRAMSAMRSFELATLIFYSTELALKLFAFNPRDWLKHGYNRLDVVVVICSWTAYAWYSFSLLRFLRVLKPLRLLRYFSGIGAILDSLSTSAPLVGNVVLLLAFFLTLFATVGLTAFSGSYDRRCAMVDDGSLPALERWCSQPDNPFGFKCPAEQYCERHFGPPNNGFTSFDNLGPALVLLARSLALTNWTESCYALMEAENILCAVYFVLLVYFVTWVVLQLFVAAVVAAFSQIRAQRDRLDAVAARTRSRRGRLYQVVRKIINAKRLLGYSPGWNATQFTEYVTDSEGDDPGTDLGGNASPARDTLLNADGLADATGASDSDDHSTVFPEASLPHLGGNATPPETKAPADPHSPGNLQESFASHPIPPLSSSVSLARDEAGSITGAAFLGASTGGVSVLRSTTSSAHRRKVVVMEETRVSDEELVAVPSASGDGSVTLVPRSDFEEQRRERLRQLKHYNSYHTLATIPKTPAPVKVRNRVKLWVRRHYRIALVHAHRLQFLPPVIITRRICSAIVNNDYFETFLAWCIVANTVVLATEHRGMSPTWRSANNTANYVFSVVFAAEMVLKIIALGPTTYWKSVGNRFDAILVTVTFVSTILPSRNLNAATLRIFRVLRVVRILNAMPEMRRLVESIFRSIQGIANLILFMIFSIFFIGVLGMELFGGRFEYGADKPRLNFDSFVYSMISVYFILTGEDWEIQLFNGLKSTSAWAAPVFYIGSWFYCYSLLINLLVAVILESFEETEEVKIFQQANWVNQQRAAKARKAASPPPITPSTQPRRGSRAARSEDSGPAGSDGAKPLVRSRTLVLPHLGTGLPGGSVPVISLTQPDALSDRPRRRGPSPDAHSESEEKSDYGEDIQSSGQSDGGEDEGRPEPKKTPSRLARVTVARPHSPSGILRGKRAERAALGQSVTFHPVVTRGEDEVDDLDEALARSQRRASNPSVKRRLSEPGSPPRRIGTLAKLTSFIRQPGSSRAAQQSPDDGSENPTMSRKDTVVAFIKKQSMRQITENEEETGKSSPRNSPKTLPRHLSIFELSAAGTSALSTHALPHAAANPANVKQDGAAPRKEEGGVLRLALPSTGSGSAVPFDYRTRMAALIIDDAMSDTSDEEERSGTGEGPSSFSPLRDLAAALDEDDLDGARKESLSWDAESVTSLTVSEWIRSNAEKIISHKHFEKGMVVIILASVAFLVIPPHSKIYQSDADYITDVETYTRTERAVKVSEYIFLAAFSLEAILRVVSRGFRAYFADNWNKLDAILLVSMWLNLLFDVLSVQRSLAHKIGTVFRVFRLLRPLRLIRRNQSMRVLFLYLLKSAPGMTNVLLLNLFAYVIFGILGTDLFSGDFESCTDGSDAVSTKADCSGVWFTATSGVLSPRRWDNLYWSGRSFDNLIASSLTLFEISTMSNWAEPLFGLMDIAGTDKQPVTDASWYNCVFVLAFIFVASLFLLNLFIGTIIENVNKEKGTAFLTEAQKNWVDYQRSLLLIKPVRAIDIDDEGCVRATVYKIVTHRYFDKLMLFCVLLNSVVLMTIHYNMPAKWGTAVDTIQIALVCFFATEAALKIFAFSPRDYLHSPWDCLDLIVTAASILALVSPLRTATLGYITAAPAFRLFGVVRRHHNLKILWDTLVITIPVMLNISLMLVLLLFTYAVLGTELYDSVRDGDEINRRANFRSLPNAMLTLFRVATGDNWNPVMHNLSIHPPKCTNLRWWNDCAPAMSELYFVTFYIMSAVIFINLVVGLILDNFSHIYHSDYTHITEGDLASFVACWSDLDPAGRGFILAEDLPELLQKLYDSKCSLVFPVTSSKTQARVLEAECELHERLWNRFPKVYFHTILCSLCRFTIPAMSLTILEKEERKRLYGEALLDTGMRRSASRLGRQRRSMAPGTQQLPRIATDGHLGPRASMVDRRPNELFMAFPARPQPPLFVGGSVVSEPSPEELVAKAREKRMKKAGLPQKTVEPHQPTNVPDSLPVPNFRAASGLLSATGAAALPRVGWPVARASRSYEGFFRTHHAAPLQSRRVRFRFTESQRGAAMLSCTSNLSPSTPLLELTTREQTQVWASAPDDSQVQIDQMRSLMASQLQLLSQTAAGAFSGAPLPPHLAEATNAFRTKTLTPQQVDFLRQVYHMHTYIIRHGRQRTSLPPQSIPVFPRGPLGRRDSSPN